MSAFSAVSAPTSGSAFDSELSGSSGKACIFFYATWDAPSKPGGQMDVVFTELASLHGKEMKFIKVEAEALPDVSKRYNVAVVPTFALMSGTTVKERVEGANAPELARKVEALAAAPPQAPQQKMPASGISSPSKIVPELASRLAKLTASAAVMIFIKGTPQEPKCKFSRQLLELLNGAGIEYGSFNILSDEDVRQGLKSFSDWPTYPQVYVRGELFGGLDILKEMAEEGDLKVKLGVHRNKDPASESGEDVMARCAKLVKSADVILFMKGSPQQPKCGFSRTICSILEAEGVTYNTFDILEDQDIRAALKTYSDWPTYPQLYVKGELLGGLDIVAEMKEKGELKEALLS
ncbi:unnamed protein product [Chrysoparadoxa australica]